MTMYRLLYVFVGRVHFFIYNQLKLSFLCVSSSLIYNHSKLRLDCILKIIYGSDYLLFMISRMIDCHAMTLDKRGNPIAG